MTFALLPDLESERLGRSGALTVREARPFGKARYTADGRRTKKPNIRAFIGSVDLVLTLWSRPVVSAIVESM